MERGGRGCVATSVARVAGGWEHKLAEPERGVDVAVTRGAILASVVILGALLPAALAPVAAEGPAFRLLSLGGHPVRWPTTAPDGRVVVTVAIADREIDQPQAFNCRRMRPLGALLQRSGITEDAFKAALDEALQRWRDVADIAFVAEKAGSKADIVIGEQSEPSGFAFTNVDLADAPRGAPRAIVGASVCLNPERRWKVGYDGDLAIYDLVHTLTHEIGHAIGLDHPDGQEQLMSFRYSEAHAGLTEGDRRGAVAIYGPSRIRTAVSRQRGREASSEAGATAAAVTTTIGRGLDGGAQSGDAR